MQLSISEICSACNGKLIGAGDDAAIVTSVSIDSRKAAPGALFVPLMGENVNGHDYITRAMAAGAVCALTEKTRGELLSSQTSADGFDSFPLIFVASARQALMDLAAYYRRLHTVRVVAVAGSAGKTTTKEMIAAVLSQRFKTKKTLFNYNNDIGMPLSIFQLEHGDEMLVLEMGMNHANEITHLSRVGAPDIAVITCIGDEHMENFANREGILHANLEITDGLHPDGTVIFNGDDVLLTGQISREKTRQFNVLYPSSWDIISAVPEGMTATRCHFRLKEQDIHLTVPLPGSHMVMNALLAAAVGLEMGLTAREISAGFDAPEMPGGRLTVMQKGGMTVINDAYNANPASMQEAIKVLMLDEKPARRVCILGDMNELGHVAEARHRELGGFAAAAGIDALITIGGMARWIHEGYLAATSRTFTALHFADAEAFLPQMGTLLFPDDIVLVKASRGMAFEKIIKAIPDGGTA